MLGTSDAWSMSRLSHGPSDPAYYIEDCLIYVSFEAFLVGKKYDTYKVKCLDS